MTSFPVHTIEGIIGYIFQNKALLEEAFTHSTYANLHGGKDNERMEYLGDAVLQLVVTDWQYARDKRADEGDLTRERQRYVCEDWLYETIIGLGLEKFLLFEGGKSNVGKKTVSSLFETVVAAIYLDGGYEPAKSFILRFGRLEKNPLPINYKGALQEYLQDLGKELPDYKTEKTGKDNAPVFHATAFALGCQAVGEGKSKKEAEQEAAKTLLEALKKKRKK
ncbi:MAG: ribonuclease III [Clostridia bacterium]|nr:ribonuclease III [Clostridia bacterium]